MDTGSLGRTVWESEEMELSFAQKSSRSSQSSASGWQKHMGDVAGVCYRDMLRNKK